jgi:hypothetical protein
MKGKGVSSCGDGLIKELPKEILGKNIAGYCRKS